MSPIPHQIRITLGRGGKPKTLEDVEAFELTNDMLELADAFSLQSRFDRELWLAARPDTKVELFIDDVRVLSGFIDDVERPLGGGGLRISGRDRGGRLLDESAPLQSFEDLDLKAFVQVMTGRWFTSISFSNAENRALIRGRGRRLARVAGEPIFTGKRIKKKVEPGETRAGALEHVFEEAEVLGWSSADGDTFVVGKPNYQQEPQFYFFLPGPGSSRSSEGNVRDGTFRRSVGERYSVVEAVGASKGDGTRYGPNVTRKRGIVYDGPEADGTGGDFAHEKWLIVSDGDIDSPEEARIRAEREKAVRDATGEELEIVARGFGQPYRGEGPPVIYAFDTIVHWEDEEAQVKGDYLITRVRFQKSGRGESTILSAVPKGTELRVI